MTVSQLREILVATPDDAIVLFQHQPGTDPLVIGEVAVRMVEDGAAALLLRP